MSEFLSALMPTFIIVAIGWGLAHTRVIAQDAWAPVEKLAYYLFFPALIVHTLANARLAETPWGLIATVLGAQLAMAAVGLLARNRDNDTSGVAGNAKGEIIQSNVRWNTFVAVAIVSSLYGQQGLAVLAIIAVALIPAANILSVFALLHYSAGREVKIGPQVWLTIVRNPLVIACLVGGALSLVGLPAGTLLERTLATLGDASVPLGLITVGAGINLSFLKSSGLRTALWSVVRLIGMPVAALGFGVALSLSPLQLAIVVIATATPTAPSGYILARQLGGNAAFSANLIALQSLAAVVTMPALFWLATTVAR